MIILEAPVKIAMRLDRGQRDRDVHFGDKRFFV